MNDLNPLPNPAIAPKPPGIGSRIRNWFLTGLVIAGPLATTAYLVYWFVNTVDQWVRPLLPERFWPDTYLPVKVPGTGVVLAFVGLTLLGFLTANFMGRTLLKLGETILDRMPVIRSIYKSLKQIFETLFSQSGTSFRKVGLVEFPTKGWWSVVFISAAPSPAVGNSLPPGEEYVTVFMCCAPNPSTGFLYYMPVKEIIELPMTVEEGFKFIMSCGLIQPDGQQHALKAMADNARKVRDLPPMLSASPELPREIQPARSKRTASFFSNK